MFTSLAGRSVVVTGASRGIGLGISTAFVMAGANVLLCARDGRALDAAVADLDAEAPPGAGRAVPLAVDVSTLAGCERLADVATSTFGGIDVLCANAGMFPERLLVDMTEADVQEIFAVNVLGTIYAVKACQQALQRSGRGRVIVTSSITGPLTGLPGWSHYGATKSAQLGFVRSAALELAPSGCTVNAVLPGNIRTEGLAALGEDYLATMTAAIPLGRLGDVSDIGNACLFLASAEAGFVTGQTLVVDGGQVLPESGG